MNARIEVPACWEDLVPEGALDGPDSGDLPKGEGGDRGLWLHGSQRNVACARAVLERQIGRRLHRLRERDLLIQLGFESLGDYAEEGLELGRRTAQEMARLGGVLEELPASVTLTTGPPRYIVVTLASKYSPDTTSVTRPPHKRNLRSRHAVVLLTPNASANAPVRRLVCIHAPIPIRSRASAIACRRSSAARRRSALYRLRPPARLLTVSASVQFRQSESLNVAHIYSPFNRRSFLRPLPQRTWQDLTL